MPWVISVVAVVMVGVGGQPSKKDSAPKVDPAAAKPTGPYDAPLPYPHPVITEVLYAVPPGADGDANRDGTRHAAGDEFVELVNPHDKAIQLRGYTIADRNAPKKGQLKFTFPAFELPPHGVVVVFNGCEQGWGKAPPDDSRIVGDSNKGPTRPNENFHGAYVFTMKIQSAKESWANTGDYVLISDASGNPVECVHWGEYKEPTPAATVVDEVPLTSKGSVTRKTIGGEFVVHEAFDEPAAAGPANKAPDGAAPRKDDGKGTGTDSKKKEDKDGAGKPGEGDKGVRRYSPGWFEPFSKARSGGESKPDAPAIRPSKK